MSGNSSKPNAFSSRGIVETDRACSHLPNTGMDLFARLFSSETMRMNLDHYCAGLSVFGASARNNLPMKLLSQIVVVLVTTGLSAHSESASVLNERTVDLGNDVSLRVIESGQPESGATLVFIPGWSTSADIWREQINRFAHTYRVISFDPRSQGKSTITTDGNTPETRAQDLHTLLDRFGARRPVLIGWSQGVEDIAAFINMYGTDDLSGIVLVDAAISPGAEGMAALGAQKAASQFATFAVYQTHQQKYLADMMHAIVSRPQSNDAIEGLVATGLQTPPDIGIAMRIADTFGVSRMPALKKINCRTLSIASAKSPVLTQQQAQAKQISHAHFEKIEDAAHAVFLDQPDRFEELLKSFVGSLATNNAYQNAATPAPPAEIDETVIPTFEQYRVASKVVKVRHRQNRGRTLWNKLLYGWVAKGRRN